MQTLDKYFAPNSDFDSDNDVKNIKTVKRKYKCISKLYTPFSPQWMLESEHFKPTIYSSYSLIQSTYLDQYEEFPANLQPVDYTSTFSQNYNPIMLFNSDDSVLLQTYTSSRNVYFYNSSILKKIHSNPSSKSDEPILSSNGIKLNYNINDLFWSNTNPSQLNIIPERSTHYNLIDLKSHSIKQNKFNFKDKNQEFIEQIKYHDENSIFINTNKDRVYMNDLRIKTKTNNWILPIYDDFPSRYKSLTKVKLIGNLKYSTNTLYCCTNEGDCIFYDLRYLSVTPFTSNKRPKCIDKISISSNLYNNNNNITFTNKCNIFKGTLLRIYNLYEIDPYNISFYLANGSVVSLSKNDLSNINSIFYIDYSDKIIANETSFADGVYSSVLFDRNTLLLKPIKSGNEYYQVYLNRIRKSDYIESFISPDYTCHFNKYNFSSIVTNHKENLIVFNENGILHLKCL